MVPEPIRTVHFINPSHHSVCLHVCPPTVARQQFSNNFIAATNTHKAIDELLYTSFSKRSVSHQGKHAITSSQNFLLENIFLPSFLIGLVQSRALTSPLGSPRSKPIYVDYDR